MTVCLVTVVVSEGFQTPSWELIITDISRSPKAPAGSGLPSAAGHSPCLMKGLQLVKAAPSEMGCVACFPHLSVPRLS